MEVSLGPLIKAYKRTRCDIVIKTASYFSIDAFNETLCWQIIIWLFGGLFQNENLKAEQKLLWQDLLENARAIARVFENEEIVTYHEVVATMKEKWSRQRQREKEIQGDKRLNNTTCCKQTELNIFTHR